MGTVWLGKTLRGYGVRSAVTMRASFTGGLAPATRRRVVNRGAADSRATRSSGKTPEGESTSFYRVLTVRLVGMLFQPPCQHVQTVGSKENLAVRDKTRHAEDAHFVCLHGLRNQLA